MEKEKLTEVIEKTFPGKIQKVSIEFGDEVIVLEKEDLLDIAKFLKSEPNSFTMLLDLTCVDYKDTDLRFEMVYHFFSISRNERLRVKVRIPEKEPEIDSLTALWKNANWLEREVFDMFGVCFSEHPDLRRLFMYDGFEGYPLRKDYPLRKRQPQIPLRKTNVE